LEIVRRMYEAFHGGDGDRALSYFDPEVLLDASRRVDGGIVRGRDNLSATIARWVGTFDEWRQEIEAMRDVGDLVYVVATQRGRGKGSGVEVEVRYAVLYEIKGGKISRMTDYPDPSEALEAAGLSE